MRLCSSSRNSAALNLIAMGWVFPYNSTMLRIYVERKPGFQSEAAGIYSEITGFLGITGVTGVRYINRYDIEHVSDDVAQLAAQRIFSEPQSDSVLFSELPLSAADTVIIWEYLPGQYDQRADSAEQCLSLLCESLNVDSSAGVPAVRCARVVILTGSVSREAAQRIENYLINPVDSRKTDTSVPETLKLAASVPADIPVVQGFIRFGKKQLEQYRKSMGLAMDFADIRFLQNYFKKTGRDPTETEIRVIDTYWSDHCRHTTFNTVLKNIKIDRGPYSRLFKNSLEEYKALHLDVYAKRTDKPFSLMDMATIGGKYLRKQGLLDDLEVSEENNACSVYIDVHYSAPRKETERWLLQFKNETHNHPTEIEPFGGAATCIGGAIRDPLSGRSWVYQALRVTGAADPTVPLSDTLPGKLPQIKLTREAAQGFASYGNQIGLTTGGVHELYHPGFAAKRMELGAVIAASPVSSVVRESPEPGDVVILVGGGTGRDGIGGATGSSKVHTEKSVTEAAAEVQKGNAVEERKIQRLFRNPDVTRIIRRSNDFGAGGVAVAVGELAPGLAIDLDAVPKKYDGLNGTELAISESQERMAVVVRQNDAAAFIAAAAAENLRAVIVASVTDSNRLVMKWRGKTIVDITRSFLDTAGAAHHAVARLESPLPPQESPLVQPLARVAEQLGCCASAVGASAAEKPTAGQIRNAFIADLNDLACCSQRGLGERFDGSIGAATVLFPYGGRYQATPEVAMAAKIPVLYPHETTTASLMSFGYDPRVAQWSSWHGAQTAVLSSLAKITCTGGLASSCRLSFQEFFGRTVDEKTWGYPVSALLGALDAQNAMGTAAIGGKDSMSGTFNNLNVPHTLVSFAVTHEEVDAVSGGSFKKGGDFIYLVQVPYTDDLAPDFSVFKKNSETLYQLNKEKKVSALYPVGAGGIAEALAKMAFGNEIGAAITAIPSSPTAVGFHRNVNNTIADLFTPLYGSIIVETALKLEDIPGFVNGTVVKIGFTQNQKEITLSVTGINPLPEVSLNLQELRQAWESKLAGLFPPVSTQSPLPQLPDFALQKHSSVAAIDKNISFRTVAARPRVVIPVFPGTNCEFDLARAFQLQGADVKVLVFRNNTADALKSSLVELRNAIDSAQIFALAGGFSAGDEPDGSGKFIGNVLREHQTADAVMSLLEKRNGLVLGICNGFQALIKTGLVPYGKILEPSAEMPTLTYNTIHRHISRVVRTRVVSAVSPWALDQSVLDGRQHLIPISHGEGRIIITDALARSLFENGQVFSQYTDEHGMPAVCEPDNPNGSAFAIEGLTSPDGRVLGKMGHNERTLGAGHPGSSADLIKNIVGDTVSNSDVSSCENIFAAGIRYFN
jgi:phosphoribosylformylglycinamidine synthase